MIPRAHITAWRAKVPWIDDAQVEQDLVLSRVLVELFREPLLAKQVVLRGGTALQKLILTPPARYSEDIDLVQSEPGPIGDIIDRIRALLDPWLGEPRRKRGPSGVTLTYRFESEAEPVQSMRLKIEINTREHFSVLGVDRRPFVVDSPWYRGTSDVAVYRLDELFGTKLRALYQRKKGRDLFDLWLALDRGLIDPTIVVDCFARYMAHGGTPVGRAELAANLDAKVRDRAFLEDVLPLLASGVSYDPVAAHELVARELVERVSETGEP